MTASGQRPPAPIELPGRDLPPLPDSELARQQIVGHSDGGYSQARQTRSEQESERPQRAAAAPPTRRARRKPTIRQDRAISQDRAIIAGGTDRPALLRLWLPRHMGILRPGGACLAQGQYVGRLGST